MMDSPNQIQNDRIKQLYMTNKHIYMENMHNNNMEPRENKENDAPYMTLLHCTRSENVFYEILKSQHISNNNVRKLNMYRKKYDKELFDETKQLFPNEFNIEYDENVQKLQH